MAKWKIDPTHSEIQFKVKHLMITTVTGYFGKFDSEVEADNDNFENAKVTFTADVDSISTNNEQRDTHLKSDDFFNAANHAQVKFKSTELRKKGDDQFVLNGDLTIRETTKPISLNVEYGGIVQDPYGQTKAGFTVTGKINRKEFGLKWDAVTEAGSVVVSDDIRINCEVQYVKQ